jgi:hypothetical protein
MEIKVPFLKEDIKLGDAIKKVADRYDIPMCGGCAKRRAIANRITLKGSESQPLATKPWTNPWTPMEYPNVPEGWKLLRAGIPKKDGVLSINLYGDDKGGFYIWHIVDGQYKSGHGFCCGNQEAVDKKMLELCH